jgi:hypothetical protein
MTLVSNSCSSHSDLKASVTVVGHGTRITKGKVLACLTPYQMMWVSGHEVPEGSYFNPPATDVQRPRSSSVRETKLYP